METMIPKFIEWGTQFGLKLIGAIVILFLGLFVAKILAKIVNKMMQRRQVDPAVVSFTTSIVKSILNIVIIIAALAQLGIQTTSFMAILGAAGLAIGLALQGSLSNFASGFLIIIFRPFKLGDYIEAGGKAGIVKKITIFTTDLNSPDNKRIIVPNSKITGGDIINYTAEKIRRVDFSFGVSYDSDLAKVKSIIEDVISKYEKVLKDPAPFVRIGELADHSINFTVRVWAKTEDYWTVHFDLIEQVKMAFDQENINIPFPQMDVHLHKSE